MFAANKYLKLAKQVIKGKHIYLRIAEKSDYQQWLEIRSNNQDFLKPYEPIWHKEALLKKTFYARVRNDKYAASADVKYAFLIFRISDNRLLGGINMNNVQRGVFQACAIGYWLGQTENSKGYMTEAVGLITENSFTKWQLNRVQAATLINNHASIKVLEKNGFEREGTARKYLKINNQWQDHLLFAKIRPDLPKTIQRSNLLQK